MLVGESKDALVIVVSIGDKSVEAVNEKGQLVTIRKQDVHIVGPAPSGWSTGEWKLPKEKRWLYR